MKEIFDLENHKEQDFIFEKIIQYMLEILLKVKNMVLVNGYKIQNKKFLINILDNLNKI